jgi:hypothetical protein
MFIKNLEFKKVFIYSVVSLMQLGKSMHATSDFGLDGCIRFMRYYVILFMDVDIDGYKCQHWSTLECMTNHL